MSFSLSNYIKDYWILENIIDPFIIINNIDVDELPNEIKEEIIIETTTKREALIDAVIEAKIEAEQADIVDAKIEAEKMREDEEEDPYDYDKYEKERNEEQYMKNKKSAMINNVI